MLPFPRKLICVPAIVLAAAGSALAEASLPATADEPRRVEVRFAAESHEIRNYDVKVKVTGKMPVREAEQPIDLDVLYDLGVRHYYGRRGVDRLLPLDISVTRAEVTTSGQKLTLLPSTFPKITVLLDESWQIKEVFGLNDYPRTVPGLNYGNLVILFFPAGLSTPRVVGETWETASAFAPYGERYNFRNTLASIVEADGSQALNLRQEMTWLPGETGTAATRATVETLLSVPAGRLLKSHAECLIEFKQPPGQDSDPLRANIQIDAAPAK